MSNFSLYTGWLQSHCSCSYSFWCAINWQRDRRLIPPVCIQWNVSLLEGQQTVSLNFLPTSSIPTKVSHLFAGRSSCRRRLQIVQPYELAKVGPGVLQALKRAPGQVICDRGVSHYPINCRNFTNVNASQQCRSQFKVRASKALINQPIYINSLFTDDYI